MKHNRQKGQVGLLFLGLFLAAVGLFVVLAGAIISEIKHQKMLEENDCSLYSEVKTGNTFHYSNGNHRDEIKRTYMCRNGWYEELV